MDNFDSASLVGFDPIAFLDAFERIKPGPWKDFVSSKVSDLLMIALREREWRATQAKAGRAGRELSAPPGALSSQYETISVADPAAGRRFFDKHRDAIAAEHEERRLSHHSQTEPAKTL